MSPISYILNGFDKELLSVVSKEASEIVKLRTTRPLFQAYEYAFNLLEHEYLPLFMNSAHYFFFLCGGKSSQTHQRSSSR